ncbi:Mitochondrial succinate-fumarate transporter [Mitosporidium daphniae]
MIATNQAVNFTLYQELKMLLQSFQDIKELPSWQHLLAGGISGAIAPCINAPIDILKTRVQRQATTTSGSGFSLIRKVASSVYKSEGLLGFYSGLTPRLLRIAPGQAITFMVYEKIQKFIEIYSPQYPSFVTIGAVEEVSTSDGKLE